MIKTFICPQNKREETSRIIDKLLIVHSIGYCLVDTDLDPNRESEIYIASHSQAVSLNIGTRSGHNNHRFDATHFVNGDIIYWYWEEGEFGQYTLFLQKNPFLTLDDPHESKCQYNLAVTRLILIDNGENLVLPNGAEKLTELGIENGHDLTNVDALKKLKQLEKLTLKGCIEFINLNVSKKLKNLTELSLIDCDLYDIKSLKKLKQLEKLTLIDIEVYTKLDVLKSHTLNRIKLYNRLDDLKNLTKLKELNLMAPDDLNDIKFLKKLKQLEKLTLYSCKELTNLDGLKNLTRLEMLDLTLCKNLTSLDGLSDVTQLTEIDLSGCSSLTNVDGLSDLKQLEKVTLDSCEELTNIDGLKSLTRLEMLDLRLCSNLTNLDGLQKLTRLETLDISGCAYLTSIAPLSELPNLKRLAMNRCSYVIDLEVLREHPALEELIWEENHSVLVNFVLLSSLTNRNATENIKNCLRRENSANLIRHMRSPDWQVPVLAKSLALIEDLTAYEEAIVLLGEHHHLTLHHWQSYFEQVFICGSDSFSEGFLDSFPPSANRPDDKPIESSNNEINTLGGLILALASAQFQYRERALQIVENALQKETVQSLREIAPAICLFYEKLGEHETVTAWIKKFTDEQDTLLVDKIQQSLAHWEIEEGKTDSACKRIKKLHNVTLRDETLTKAIMALAEKEPPRAGELFDDIHSGNHRKELAQTLQDQPNFTAIPENDARLLIVLQEETDMLSQFIVKLIQVHPNSEFLEILATAFQSPNEPIIEEKDIKEKFIERLHNQGIFSPDQVKQSRSFILCWNGNE